MPPRRGRGGARGGARAASRDVDGAREATPVMQPSRRTPAPIRYSSSYGSPVVLGNLRNASGGNARSAIGAALENLEAADEEDLRSSAPNGHDLGNGASIGEDDARAMPPPPLPSRQGNHGPRASTVQPSNSFDAGRSKQGRNGSEPLHSDAMSHRSFVEENQIYGGADVATPRQPRTNGTNGTNGTGRSQQSPATRASARIAARNSVPRDESVSPTDDSIDEDDEEDPLLNPTPRGYDYRKGSVSGHSPSLSDRMRRARLARGARPLSFSKPSDQRNGGDGSDHGDDTSDELLDEQSPVPSQRDPLGLMQNRPNPVQDARTDGLRLPRPDRFNNKQHRAEDAPYAGILPNGNLPNGNLPRGNLLNGNLPRGNLPNGNLPNGNLPSGILPNSFTNGGSRQPNNRGNGSGSSNARSSQLDNRNNTGSAGNHPRGNGGQGRPVVPGHDGADDTEDGEDEEENLFSWTSRKFLDVFRFRSWPPGLRKALEVFGLLTLLCWLALVLLELFVPVASWEGIRVGKNYTLYGVAYWRQNIAQIVPWIVLHPLAVLTGNLDYADYRNQLRWAEINIEHNAIRLDFLAGAVGQMRKILPELIAIKVDKASDKWTVDDAFWFAMNEQMKKGSMIHSLLTLKKSEDGSYTISDSHWEAIVHRIQGDGMLISDQPAASDGELALTDDIMDYVDQSVSQTWEDWLKDNEDAIKRARGDEKGDPSPHWQDLYGNVEKAIAQRLKDLGLEERVVTREKFIQELQHQSDQYAAQIRVEMDAMQSRLGQVLEIAEAAKSAADVPCGMSREEVKSMIDSVVRRSIADAQLECIAKGHIKASLDSDLLKRKNFFSTLRGAVVDHTMTSTSYNWGTKADAPAIQAGSLGRRLWPFGKKESIFREGGETSGVSFASGKALEKWEEDGDCWCAGLGDGKGITKAVDLSIITADTVIPQHLVVEHIAASASFDPEAMPKDIEVWMRSPTDKRSRTLKHWSSERWDMKGPDANRLVQRGFVKIGEFQYDNSVAKGESQLFKFPEELLNMDAQTRQVLVRATTNYGSEDHTCFYRLRLFGDEGRNQDEGVFA